MAGNSQRKGARRTPGSKKGATVGSGGRQSKGLRPKGPTPRAQDREKAAKRSGSPGARAAGRPAFHAGREPVRSGGGHRCGRPALRRGCEAFRPGGSGCRADLAQAGPSGAAVRRARGSRRAAARCAPGHAPGIAG